MSDLFLHIQALIQFQQLMRGSQGFFNTKFDEQSNHTSVASSKTVGLGLAPPLLWGCAFSMLCICSASSISIGESIALSVVLLVIRTSISLSFCLTESISS